jgi:hypothetical protein
MREIDLTRYLLYSRLASFQRRVAGAERIIQSFMGGGDIDVRNRQRPGLDPPAGEHECYVSISWGKDSTVLLHLVWLLCGEKTNAISVQYGTPHEDGSWTIEPFDRWPDLVQVRDAFLQRCALSYAERWVPSFWYLCEKYDCIPTTIDMVGAGPNIGQVEKELLTGFEREIDGEARQRGFSGNLMGMRREESRNRARHFAMRGHTYFNASRGFWCCNPLHNWTGDDIWAYIVSRNLPYSELYDADGWDRNTLRNGLMIGGGMQSYGAYLLLKRLYPEMWNRVCGRYPFLRGFA